MAFYPCSPTSRCIVFDHCHYIPDHETLIETTKDFDFAAALISKYDIVEVILNYLSNNDLHNLAQLNTLWATHVNEVLEKRIAPYVFSITDRSSYWVQPKPHNTSKSSLSIVFINQRKIKLNQYLCIHKAHDQTDSKKPAIEFLENDVIMSKKSPLLTLSCEQNLICQPPGMLFNGVVLPVIPNINISIFRISNDKRGIGNISTTLKNQIGEDNYVTCLLAFGLTVKTNIILSTLRRVIANIRGRHSLHNFSFGGGLVNGIKSFNIEEKKRIKKADEITFVTFSKPRDLDVMFESYSLKIAEPSFENEPEELIMELKKNYKRRKYSVVFRFSCESLDKYFKSVISTFKKHFPDTEMIGFSCNGEIGWTNVKQESDGIKRKKRKPNDEPLLDFFSIIFVVLTWGKEL